jgi:hypothetical protein
MPQLHLYVPEEVAAALREKARARGVPLSRLLAEIVRREATAGWPAHFFEDVVGAWEGELLERPDQGEVEEREPL